MKTFLIKWKGDISKALKSLSKYDVCIYICLSLTITYLLLSFRSEIVHTREIFKKNIEIAEHEMQFRVLLDIITQQDNVRSDQEEHLQEASGVIRAQRNAIEQLINELKKAGKWPSEIKPTNPNDAT